MTESIMSFFKNGGAFMYPIAIIGMIAIAIVIERVIIMQMHMSQIKKSTRKFSQQIEKDKDVALDTLKSGSSLLSLTLRDAIKSYQKLYISKEAFEELLSIQAIHSVRLLTRRTAVISTLANVATLLGLLGTIMGLIQSFASVAQAGGNKSAMLSASVSVAMNTTAFGLMVAIPLLLLYMFIDNASNKSLESLQIGCATVTNKIYSSKQG